MTRAFLAVALQMWKNRVLFRLKRLREVRYLLSAILGAAYFGYIFLRSGARRHGPQDVFHALTVDIASIVALTIMLLAWIIPAMSSLEFSEAELQFLFPAPLTRARLLLYKIIRSQPAILISCLIATAFHVPNGRFVGLWIAYTCLGVYMTFVAIVRARLVEARIPSLVQSIVAAALLGGAFVTIVHFAHKPVHRGASPFDHPVIQAVLLAPKFFVTPLFAKSIVEVLLRTSLVVAFAAVLFLLSARLRVPFEEMVVTASQRAANWREARSSRREIGFTIKRIPAPFRLRENAAPEMAIVWKNLTAAARIAVPWIAILVLGYTAIVVQGLVTHNPDTRIGMLTIAFGFCAFFPLVGAGIFKQDFRLDVRNLDLLKTFPLRGERLVAAELAAPILLISVIEIYFLIGAIILTVRSDMHAEIAPELGVIALLFAIPVCSMQLVLRNAVPIFLPGWSGRTKEDQRGFGAVGYRLLGMIANLVVLGLTLAPAAAAGAIGYIIAERIAANSAAIHAAATMPAVALLAAEVWVGVKLLGAQYDRLDASRDVEPSTA